MNYRYSGRQAPQGWMAMVKYLKEAVVEENRVWNLMTDYEKLSIQESISEMREQYRPTIEAGALGNWWSVVRDLKAALATVEDEKRKNTNSWDAAQLAAEMQVAVMRVNQAAKSDAGRFDLAAMQAIYQEAQEAQDRYKLRAVCEAMRSLVSQVPAVSDPDPYGTDPRLVANRMANQAKRDLESLKNSEGLVKAHAAAEVKVNELAQAKGVLLDAAEALGDMDMHNYNLHNTTFENAIASVKQDENNNFIFSE